MEWVRAANAKMLWAGLALSSLLAVTSCRQTSAHRMISVIPRQSSESMWVSEHAGVNEAAARAGVGVYWNGPMEDGDVEQQIVLAERARASGNMGLVLSPSNPFALNTVIQRSLDDGMSVVIVGTPVSLNPEKHLSFVLNDAQETGRIAATRMREILKGKGEVLILGYDPMLLGRSDRSSAFESILEHDSPGIHIVDKRKGPFSFGQAELAAEKAIRAHPHLSAIFSLNTMATRGAVAAVRTTHSSGRILIVGCDQNLDLFYLLRQGAIDSIIAQNMHAMGMMAIDAIVTESHGGHVEPYRFVKPQLLTRANIDDESIQQMLMMDWRSKS
jgi:ribose transport system substrate-binding protein